MAFNLRYKGPSRLDTHNSGLYGKNEFYRVCMILFEGTWTKDNEFTVTTECDPNN